MTVGNLPFINEEVITMRHQVVKSEMPVCEKLFRSSERKLIECRREKEKKVRKLFASI